MAIEKGKYAPPTILSLKVVSIFEKPVHKIFKLENSDWQSKTSEENKKCMIKQLSCI